MGTCVETLTDDGATMPAGTSTEGNFVLCHWFYVVAQSANLTGTTLGGLPNYSWGETRYLTETDWGTNGSNIIGTKV